ncbi:penicillin-binding protein 2 [Candidatus Synechococcus calcipolaris G9]|uniref:Penicillin-binding protein 2 n=1 Tax=Candidatus Synechococcus calcipolaris G9 TaxID=1497997 RepID=A0ABT6EV59_9SYNE|nr:penicillin-binding protein 2 [Candidatus Synechococcus calcipolaris]MDG2989716.1 penicillin-binding protein 2 [Candidatus Synechococcus calcipolaris G9]
MAVGLSSSSESLLRWRLRFVSLFLLTVTSLVVGRLTYLQVVQGPILADKAREQQQQETPPTLARYPISDRRGTLLALDRPVFNLFAHPIQFSEPPEEIAAQVAPLLDVPVSGLEEQLRVAPTGIPIAYDVTESVASQIRNLYLDGLEFNQSWQRIYPQQELMAGIIGYVDREHQGQAGLEFSQNEFFQAPPEQPVLSSDALGQWLPELAPEDPQLLTQGYGIRLSLDSRLQRTARQSLRQQLQKFNAKRGTVIVLNSQTGAILSLVSEPSYNPTHYYRADPALFRNWAISDLYEPGSTFKPINTAIALELRGITPTTVLPDEGRITVGGWPVQNNDFSQVGGRGSLSISQILSYSSNVAMVHMMNRIPARHYYRYLDRLGLNKPIGSDLPFETAAQLKPARQFIDYPIEPATTSFGQGFSLTPLHLAQLLGTIANGGELVVPYTVEGLYDHQGRLKQPLKRPQPRRVFSTSTSRYVLNMMGDVVRSGTGKGAQIPGYRLGGKTGTAQKAIGGTYSNQRITSFAAIFPLESPRYVVLTVVDEPQGDDAYGSTVAIPVVKSVLESLITIEGIPPSHPEELRRSPPQTPSP